MCLPNRVYHFRLHLLCGREFLQLKSTSCALESNALAFASRNEESASAFLFAFFRLAQEMLSAS
jgi:hypothetical protein